MAEGHRSSVYVGLRPPFQYWDDGVRSGRAPALKGVDFVEHLVLQNAKGID